MIKKLKKEYFKDEYLLTNIGNKIRELRNLKGISIEQLANESDIDYSQLSRMELGKINFSVSFLSKIAKALKVDPRELLP